MGKTTVSEELLAEEIYSKFCHELTYEQAEQIAVMAHKHINQSPLESL